MSLILTDDRLAYRLWVKIVPSVLIPGACQFLAGRKRVGLLFFLAANFLGAVAFFLAVAPMCKSIIPAAIAGMLMFFMWLFAIIDGCLNPLPRLNWKTWISVISLAVLIALVCVLCLRQFVGRCFTNSSRAMQPTLMGDRKSNAGQVQKGDRFTVNMYAYRLKKPQRGDVVIFNTRGISPSLVKGDSLFVKRVVGIPGDKVSINPPSVLVNGVKLAEPEIFKRIAECSNGYAGYTSMGLLGQAGDEIALGEDEYFVLGDNSTNSLDGRFFGAIKRDAILGKVVWIYWPPDRRGKPE